MKTSYMIITLIFSLFNSSKSFAIYFEVTNVCKDTPYLQAEVPVYTLTNVLEFTKYNLKNYAIPHLNNENGIVSILDTPVGLQSYEFIAQNHIRIYGWCFEVDGEQSETFARDYTIDPEFQTSLRWFYGYSEVIEGVWIHNCRAVNKVSNPQICQKF
ncbi:MAG: hypothetical protein VYA54_05435 [Bdellovibrionota bacterium]|nr:hypothetical protein [Bdellovibrionota bacterium]